MDFSLMRGCSVRWYAFSPNLVLGNEWFTALGISFFAFHVTVPDTAQEGKKGFKFVHVAKWHVRGSRPLWEDSRRCFVQSYGESWQFKERQLSAFVARLDLKVMVMSVT